MKKLMILAFVVLFAMGVQAQDAKPILKAKTYEEAASLLQSSLSALSNEDKAKAYNKLVDLSLAQADAQLKVLASNQAVSQGLPGKIEPYDTLGLYNAVYNALDNALLCDKYDMMPNEKGKVKPKFHTSNQNRLWPMRLHLVNAGQDAAQKEQNDLVLKYWGMYTETSSADLFKEKSGEDQYVGQVSKFAARYAIQAKDMEKAKKYIAVAMKDPEEYKEALNLKLYIEQENLKTKEDSLNYVNELKELYAQDTKNEVIFGTLCNMYNSMKMSTELQQLIGEKLAQEPNNVTAWLLKGQDEMNSQKWDDAIKTFKHALTLDGENVLCLTYLGYSINAKAGGADMNVQAQKQLYKESMTYLEKAKSLDPNCEKANWVYSLYQCYYVNYGAQDARTKELEEKLK